MSSGQEQLISQVITVVRDENQGHPISFEWNKKEYAVREIIAVWPDWGFSSGSPNRKNWRMRRHRNCYRVETTDGAVFELYHDRGLKISGGKWILHTRLK